MRLDDSRESDNVEDRRGMSVGRVGGGVGLGTLAIVVIGYFMGVDPSMLLGLLQGGGVEQGGPAQVQEGPPARSNEPDVVFVKKILGLTEDVWTPYFQGMGKRYTDPRLVLFNGQVESACGFASAASGPFYCPGDTKVYIDLSFYQQLAQEFGAPGEFARAYVIAHEVGHHVQNLLGVTDKAAQQEQAAGRTGANHISVEVELQADCFAGVWAQIANRDHHVLEPGDVESGLKAAAAVGDDTLQKRTRGTVVPDSFTHGTSAQRVHWFQQGYNSGKIESCNTFGAGSSL
jgi:uncharacterized protein